MQNALLVVAGIVLGILFHYIYSYIKENFVPSEPVATSEEEAQVIADSRNMFVTNLLATLIEVLNVDIDDVDKDIHILGYQGALMTCIFKNTQCRFYIHWNGKVKVVISSRWSDRIRVHQKTFYYKTLVDFSLEKLNAFLDDFYRVQYLKYIKREAKALGMTYEQIEDLINAGLWSDDSDDSEEEIDTKK